MQFSNRYPGSPIEGRDKSGCGKFYSCPGPCAQVFNSKKNSPIFFGKQHVSLPLDFHEKWAVLSDVY